MNKLLLSALVVAGLAFGGISAFSQEEPQNTAEEQKAPEGQAGGEQYTVKEGDSLSKIAKQFYGTQEGWQAIAEANSLANPNMILPGQNLTIPAKPEMAASAPAPAEQEQQAMEQKPAEESQQQAAEEQKPATEEGKQAAEEQKPAEGNEAAAEQKPAEETETAAKEEPKQAEQQAAAGQTEIKGEVTAVAAPDLKLKDEKGTEHSLKVEDGKMLEGIKVGDDVKVTLTKGKPTAIEKIESMTKKEG